MKKVLIIVGCVVLYLLSIFGTMEVSYRAGYSDAMKDVETKVLEGIEEMGNLFKLDTNNSGNE